MFKKLKWLNLQLFADGADGGDAAGESEGEANTGEDETLSRIPERARENYKKALAQTKASVPSQTTNDKKEEKPAHVAYTDLIKSDDYKDEHKAYMDKAIGDRLKKYKGIESENQSMKDALSIVANKYGLDPSSEGFIESLQQKINEDNSYYEDYAMEHNISAADAKEILTLKQRVKAQEEQQRIAEQEAKNNEWNQLVVSNAERTKAMYPSFDLNTEWQNEQFKRLVWSTNGDTTAAYRTLHWEELSKAQGLQASQKASQQIANAMAANKSRPIENGLSAQASSITTTDWSKASLADIRRQADEWRRGKR